MYLPYLQPLGIGNLLIYLYIEIIYVRLTLLDVGQLQLQSWPKSHALDALYAAISYALFLRAPSNPSLILSSDLVLLLDKINGARDL